MGKLLGNLHLTRISLGLAAVLLLCAASSLVQAQQPPLVYTVENTGASLPLTGTLPSMAQAPIIRQFPDPFVFRNGTRDTTWASEEQHRQEWMNAVTLSEVGPKPACTGTSADNVLGATYSCSVTASYTHASGTTYTLSITVTVVGPTSALNSTPTTKTLTTTASIVLPTASATFTPSTGSTAGSCGPVPANGWPIVIGMTGPTGSWPASAFTTATAGGANVTVSPTGCAATVNFSTAYSAFGAYATSDGVHNADGFYKLYPTLCAGQTSPGAGACDTSDGFPNGSNSGEYAAWAFALSRIVDGLEDISSPAYCNANLGACASNTPLPLDITHSATTGCSYAGKMALWTGALDERIALVLSQENGGGGAPSWRISHEIETQGSVEDIGDTDYDWFDSTLLSYSGGATYNAGPVYKMPEDHFELMAMVAPRALLQTGDSAYYWLGDRSATFDSLATAAVYNNYGIGDRFGYYVDTVHAHCVVPAYQQNATQPTINRFLFGTTTGPNAPAIPQQSWLFADALQPGAQPTYDPNFWTAWWGTGTPAFPPGEVWNWGGDLMLPLNQNITVNTNDTITTQYQLMMPGTHKAASVRVPTAFSEVDIACTDGTSYTLTVPAANSSGFQVNNHTYTIPATSNSTYPSAVYSVTNPGCDNGQPGQTTGTYFFAVGLPNPGSGNPGEEGFETTDGVQLAAQTDPLQVTFSVTDTTNGQGGTLAPWTTVNYQNPYSCTPNGCPITPTITWTAPASITSGTALSATQLNATASETEIAGLNVSGTPAAGTGLYTTVPIAGTWTYNPPAGTVLSPGVQTLTVTFTPATGTIMQSNTSASNAYEYETIATATVPIDVVSTPTVTVTPSPSSITTAAGTSVTVSVSGTPTPTGAVTLTSGSYTSAAATLSNGSATITVPAGALASGTDTLTATYGPDVPSSFIYTPATGTAMETVVGPPAMTVTPSPSSVATTQSLSVTVAVSGTPTPTGSVMLTSGSYTSAAATLSSGSATISIPAGTLAKGTDTLTATYTPDLASSLAYTSAIGSNTVTVTALTAPTVTVTPSPSSITTSEGLSVTVAVSGTPTPTGSVVLTSGSYTSTSTTLSSGSATISVSAGSLAKGIDTLTATYTPDPSSSSIYTSSTGSNTATVTTPTAPAVTVTPSPSSITTAQGLSVTVAVSGTPIPTGWIVLTGGIYTSPATVLSSGSATFSIATGSLAKGTETLTATYTPDSTSYLVYTSATGSNTVTVTAPTAPAVTVTPSPSSITTSQGLSVTVAVSGTPTPTGSVVLTSSSYTSAPATLSNGSASVSVPAGSLATGVDTLKASYAPDSSSSPIYTSASGSNSVTVTAVVAPSFTVSSSTGAQTTTAGGTATYTVTVTPQNGAFTSAVALSAASLPAGATATFSPNSMTPGSSPATSTLTIQTASTTASTKNSHWPLALSGLGVIGLFFLPGKRRRRALAMCVLTIALLNAVATLAGCSSATTIPNSPQAYTVTIWATGGGQTQFTTVQLTVQ